MAVAKGFAAATHITFVIGLTLLTQVGGVIYLVALGVRRVLPRGIRRSLPALIVLFAAFYAVAWPVVGVVAAAGGRIGLPCTGTVLRVGQPQIFCVLHRHYVSPQLYDLLAQIAGDMDAAMPGTVTQALDAGFPFINGFPLLPHLSHDDGGQVDLAFYYADRGGYLPGALRSPFGYWAFEPPPAATPSTCPLAWPTLRWNMEWLQPLMRSDLTLDAARTRLLLRVLVEKGPRLGLGRMFVEPHIPNNLGIEAPDLIGFQGCRAARHDDHLHVQMR